MILDLRFEARFVFNALELGIDIVRMDCLGDLVLDASLPKSVGL